MDLLPCPLCGSVDNLKINTHDTTKESKVKCYNCQCVVFADDETTAILKWNTRAQSVEIEQLKNDVKFLTEVRSAQKEIIRKYKSLSCSLKIEQEKLKNIMSGISIKTALRKKDKSIYITANVTPEACETIVKLSGE